MKKHLVVAIILVICIVVGICLFTQTSNNTVYDDPRDMSGAALDCVFGWKDINMFMDLTPYTKGTSLYNSCYNEVIDIMQYTEFEDTFTINGYDDLRDSDRDYYNEVIDILSTNGIPNVTTIRSYTYRFDNYDEITIYVAKIGKQWYTISIEY